MDPYIRDPGTGVVWSPDRQWWWDGQAWRPAAPAPYPPHPGYPPHPAWPGAPAPVVLEWDRSVTESLKEPHAKWGLAVVLTIVWVAIAEWGLTVLVGTGIHPGFIGVAAILIAGQASFGVAAVVAAKVAEIPGGWRAFGVGRFVVSDLWRAPGWVFLQFGARIALLTVITIVAPGLLHGYASNVPPLKGVEWQVIALLAFVAVILAPLTEEIVCRGLILRAVARRHGFVWGTVVSSALFGLAHSYQETTWAGAFVIAAMMGTFGAVQCVLVRQQNRLAPAMAVHGLTNAIALLLSIVITTS